MSDIVEVVARRIGPYSRIDPSDLARAALAALEAAGFAVVPVVPTKEMLASVRWDDEDATEGWSCMLSAYK